MVLASRKPDLFIYFFSGGAVGGGEKKQSDSQTELGSTLPCSPRKWAGTASRHPTLIATSTEVHVPFTETEHSRFSNICTKGGETSADLMPNSTVNTRCFF